MTKSRLNQTIKESLRRPGPFRNQRKSILIALEDERSARLYFESIKKLLRSERVIVIAEHAGSAPKSVVNAAKRANEKREKDAEHGLEDSFDEVWVVFDTEGPQNRQRQLAARSAIDQAHQLKFKTAVSNPAFEFWLLLHFEWTVQMIKDDDAACRLLRLHIKGYRKNTNPFESTWEHVGTAIERAKRIFKERFSNTSEHPCDCHPCTEVYRLVEALRAEI